jgi:aspartate carbamoyltransferase catalytic subunit
MQLKGSHFLSVDQLQEVNDIKIICELANQLEVISQRKKMTRILEGAVLSNLFFEPSTRTRLSFGTAFNLLGGEVRDTTGFTFSSMAKGESIHDTSRCISGYADIMVVRHPDEGAVAQFAAASKVPVINGGDGVGEHPTQALLDVYTIVREYGKGDFNALHNLTITLVGDLKHGRTVHSLTKLLSLFEKVTFNFVSPPELAMPAYILEIVHSRGCKVIETDNLTSVTPLTDVIYITRIQEERFSSREAFLQYAGKYSIDLAFYQKYCPKHPTLMHPLPRDSRLTSPEINDDLNQHPRLAMFRQSDNGVALRMALFCLVLGIEEKIFASLKEVPWYFGMAK